MILASGPGLYAFDLEHDDVGLTVGVYANTGVGRPNYAPVRWEDGIGWSGCPSVQDAMAKAYRSLLGEEVPPDVLSLLAEKLSDPVLLWTAMSVMES